jgi:uracil-DNA glycosylase
MIAEVGLAAALESLPKCWAEVLPGWTAGRIRTLIEKVTAESGVREIGPDRPLRALELVRPEDVKVVIIGQDPYPGSQVADGLAFSAAKGKPASLRRIFQILALDEPGFEPPEQWTLDPWAAQGVLLLNTVLSIEIDRVGSHLDCGWQALTGELVTALAARAEPPAFLLWGALARSFFDKSCPIGAHPRVLRSRHPSNDYGRTFMADGSHFSATRDLVNWWVIDRKHENACYTARLAAEGCPSG